MELCNCFWTREKAKLFWWSWRREGKQMVLIDVAREVTEKQHPRQPHQPQQQQHRAAAQRVQGGKGRCWCWRSCKRGTATDKDNGQERWSWWYSGQSELHRTSNGDCEDEDREEEVMLKQGGWDEAKKEKKRDGDGEMMEMRGNRGKKTRTWRG